jgi:MFS family permease
MGGRRSARPRSRPGAISLNERSTSASAGAPGLARLGGALLAGYPLVFARSQFRALFLVLLLAGTASGMAMAYVAVWANETFGIGPQAVATLFVVSGLVGAAGNPLIGLLSDRFGWRRRLIVGQLALTSLAYLGYTQAMTYTAALLLVAFSGFGVMGLVLAMVNDLVRALPEDERRDAVRILSAERTAWSIGIILGPAAAAAIVTATGGTRPVFVAAALVQCLAAAMVSRVRATSGARRATGKTPDVKDSPTRWPRTVPLVALVAGLVLVLLPAQTRTMYLPLFVTGVLREPAGAVGPLFTLNAFVAVLTMPHVGSLAERFGAQRVLYLSILVGVVYCLLQSAAVTYSQTVAIQMLVGFGIALWSTSSLIYLQHLLAGRAGAAGGLYVATQQLTPVLSGLLLGPIAEAHGIPAAFAATAALGAVALVLMVSAHRALGRT